MGDQFTTIEGHTVTLPLVSNEVPLTYEVDDLIFFITLFLVFIGFFFLSLTDIIPFNIFPIVLILVFTIGYKYLPRIRQKIRKHYRDYIGPDSYVGQAIFTIENIEIRSSEKELVIPFQKINAIHIKSNQFQGAVNFRQSSTPYKGIAFSGQNRFCIHLHDDTEEIITCIIPDEAHMENMVPLIKNWHQLGIAVKEFSPNTGHKLNLFCRE